MALIWHGNRVQKEIWADMRRRIAMSVEVIEANAKGMLKKGGSTQSGTAQLRAGTKRVMEDPETGEKAGKIGSYRSKPGEPPRTQTGHLLRSIASEMHPTLPIGRAGVTKSAPYGKHLEFGTRPHTIAAKRVRILTDGTRFFGRKVKHPGIAPRPFMRPAIKRSVKTIEWIMKKMQIGDGKV